MCTISRTDIYFVPAENTTDWYWLVEIAFLNLTGVNTVDNEKFNEFDKYLEESYQCSTICHLRDSYKFIDEKEGPKEYCEDRLTEYIEGMEYIY